MGKSDLFEKSRKYRYCEQPCLLASSLNIRDPLLARTTRKTTYCVPALGWSPEFEFETKSCFDSIFSSRRCESRCHGRAAERLHLLRCSHAGRAARHSSSQPISCLTMSAIATHTLHVHLSNYRFCFIQLCSNNIQGKNLFCSVAREPTPSSQRAVYNARRAIAARKCSRPQQQQPCSRFLQGAAQVPRGCCAGVADLCRQSAQSLKTCREQASNTSMDTCGTGA